MHQAAKGLYKILISKVSSIETFVTRSSKFIIKIQVFEKGKINANIDLLWHNILEPKHQRHHIQDPEKFMICRLSVQSPGTIVLSLVD